MADQKRPLFNLIILSFSQSWPYGNDIGQTSEASNILLQGETKKVLVYVNQIFEMAELVFPWETNMYGYKQWVLKKRKSWLQGFYFEESIRKGYLLFPDQSTLILPARTLILPASWFQCLTTCQQFLNVSALSFSWKRGLEGLSCLTSPFNSYWPSKLR